MPGAEAERNSGGVNSHVSAADYGHPVTGIQFLAQVYLPQESGPVKNAGAVFSVHPHLHAAVRSGPGENGVKTLFEQAVDRLNPGVQQEVHPGGLYFIDFAVQFFRRQAVIGNAHPHHAPRLGQRFKNGDPVPLLGQVESGRQASRAGTNYAHFFTGRR